MRDGSTWVRTGTRQQPGFVLIELLVVLVVIAMLAGAYFNHNPDGGAGSESTYERSMARSNDAACLANRSALRTSVEMFRMNNPSTPVTTENLQKAGYSVATCPDGGAYGYTKEATLLCSKHP